MGLSGRVEEMGSSGFRRDASGVLFCDWESQVLGSREKMENIGKRERERETGMRERMDFFFFSFFHIRG